MDKLLKSISANGHFRAFALDSTDTVREAQLRHQTMPSSTVALGRTLIAAQILAANEKGNTKITVKIIGDGAMGALLAVADSSGNAKGYVQNTDLDYKRISTGEVIVGSLVGNGSMVVIKDLGLGQPYSGQVDLITGEIGDDLAWYFLSSEQTPSSVGLAVELFEGKDDVKSAGGFMLQALPGATDEEITTMEQHIQDLPALSTFFNSEAQQPLDLLLSALYGDLDYKILSESPLQFSCDCSKERFAAGIASLGNKEITDMIEEDHGAEIICQFCNRRYFFTEKELNDIILND